MLPKLSNIIGTLIFYFFSVFYSSIIGILFIFALLFKKVFISEVKLIKEPPENLNSEEFGVHKFAHINGIKLHYVEKGDPKNPLIIFVHGFPEFWYSWRHQLKEFSKDYWTIAIDQRGYGQSDKPENIDDYCMNNMADDIHELVKSLGRKKFILIGHDWGGVIGFNYVYRYMDTIDKYIMIGGPESHAWRKVLASSFKQFIMSWYIFFFRMPILPETVMKFNNLQIFDLMGIGTKEDVDCFKYTFSKSNSFTAPLNYYRAIRLLYPDARIPRHAPKNCAPGLLLIGEFDKYIANEVGEITKKYLENFDFKMIKRANHFAQQNQPEETNKMIREFLEKN